MSRTISSGRNYELNGASVWSHRGCLLLYYQLLTDFTAAYMRLRFSAKVGLAQNVFVLLQRLRDLTTVR